jgi:hypothetical protein
MMGIMRLACILLYSLGWLGFSAPYRQAAPPPLDPFSPQIFTLDAQNPTARFEIRVTEETPLSLSAESLSGGVDPVLRLLDETGAVLAENDNQTRQSPSARLEALVVPSGRYQVEVSRAGDERALFAGQVRLLYAPQAESLLVSPLPPPAILTLEAGKVWTLIPALDASLPYYEIALPALEADWAGGALFGLQLLAEQADGEGSRLLVLGATGLTLQRTVRVEDGTLAEEVLADFDFPLRGALSVGGRLTTGGLRLNLKSAAGEQSLDLPNVWPPRAKSLRLLALPDSPTPVTVQKPRASTPFYHAGRPLSMATPPLPANERLFYMSDPAPSRVLEELRALGYIGAGGGLIFDAPDALIETSELGFSTFPLYARAEGVSDFVLYYRVTTRGGDPQAVCGLSFRAVTSETFSAALTGAEGAAFLLAYREGALVEPSLALTSPFVGTENAVLLVVQGENATFFVNGARLGTRLLPRGAGDLALILVLRTGLLTRCSYRQLWLWELPAPD